MKNIIAAILVVAMADTTQAQTLNWSAIQESQQHLVNVNAGWDFAATIGLGYGYKLKTKMKMPVMLSAQVSAPTGNNLVDDFKSKLGGQVRVYKTGNFLATVHVYGIFRGYKSDLVKLQNFGSEFIGVFGYYKSKWFAAAEFGFDKAIATHIKNSELMKDNYPGVQDGWYVPTGGNFNFGIQGGYSIKTFDVTVKAGKTVDQRFQSTAMVPFYFQLGVNKRF